jgi:hypothetical protein
MSKPFAQISGRTSFLRRKLLPLAVVAATSLSLGGCLDQLVSFNCKRVKSTELHVGADATCEFNYGYGDTALYKVVVTQGPTYGEAKGDGAYLRYVAKPGFIGEDRLAIRVVRQGIGHVQWQNLSVTVKVGEKKA